MIGPPGWRPDAAAVYEKRFATSSSVRAFEALCDQRVQRARVLADRFPESSDALRFYERIASFQKDASPAGLLDLVASHGPELLRELAGELDERACNDAVDAYISGDDRSSPRSFFGRVLLQARAPDEVRAPTSPRDCPACGQPPQLGCLVVEGHGTALTLSCSICFHEWRHAKELCPGCGGEELVHYHARELEHLEIQACDGCKTYLNIVRLEKAPDAVPDVDEIAALPLDVWASEHGYRKLVRNLVGI